MIREILKENITEVTFRKANGELRVMVCTLKEDLLPEKTSTGTRTPNPDVIAAFDLEKDNWRSFREDSIVSHRILNQED